MMKPILYGLLAAGALSLSACTDSTSDTMEVDQALNTNPNNADSESYSGRAMDGYLQNALVWLDLNDNKILEANEPSARTTVGGQFSLDLSAINDERRAAGERILDPRNYPLMVIAIPGETVEEAGEGQTVPVSEGYFMMAPAGSTLVSPLTTLVKIQRDLTYSQSDRLDAEKMRTYTSEAHNFVRSSLGVTGNLLSNYVISKDSQYQAYAISIAEMIRRNAPDSFDTALRSGNFGVFNSDSTKQLGRLALAKAGGLWLQIDELAKSGESFDYARVAPATDIAYEVIALDFENPYLLKSEITFKNPALVDGEDLVAVGFNLIEKNISTDLQYVYNENAELLNIVVDGYKDFDPIVPFGFSPLTFLIGTELFQFWGKDLVADQIFDYSLQGNAFNRITLDTRHPLDFQPELSKSAAKDMLVNQPDAYVLDGATDRDASYTIQQGRPISASVSDTVADSSLQYVEDGLGRIASIIRRVGGVQVQQIDYTYDYVKPFRENDIVVAFRTDEYSVADGEFTLQKSIEYYTQPADIQGQSVDQLYQVFITDNTREKETQYMIWEVDYYDAVEVTKEAGIETPRLLSSSKPEDVTLAQELIRDLAEVQLEGKIRQANLFTATDKGLKKNPLGASSTISTIRYNYQRLSDFVFGLPTE